MSFIYNKRNVKMKKNIALIISFMTLFFAIFKMQVYYEKEPVLTFSGEKITNYFYNYNLNSNSLNELTDTAILNNKLFYLSNSISSYTLFSRNIYDSKENKIKEFNADWCEFTNKYVTCNNNEFIYFYNLENNREIKIVYEDNTSIIPYKDTYLKLSNNKLTLLENKNQHIFRDLKNKYLYQDFYYTKDNTFILLEKDNLLYLYNIKDNSFQKLENSNIKNYSNGFYTIDENKIIVYDLLHNNIKEYSYNEKIALESVNILAEDNKTLYLINDETLEIINLDQNFKKIINLKNYNIKSLTNIFTINNYIYLENILENNLALLDLNTYPEKNIQTILKTSETKENNKDLFASYNINLKTKERAIIEFPDFKAELLTDETILNNAINKLEKIISKFNNKFFNNFYANDANGLNIYLTGNLTPSDFTSQIANPAAYSLFYNNEYMIVIDINENNLEELLCHELMHNIEFNSKSKKLDIFSQWEEFNPKDFYYSNSYTKISESDYTIKEQNINNVYFIDSYSHTYKSEDMARIFEQICSVDTSSIINNYPNLKKKGNYLKEVIVNNYPELNESTLFNSLN